MIRKASILGLSMLLGACATAAGHHPAPALPTENFTLQTASTVDQIALAPHAEGLSAAQRAAVADLAQRFHSAGGEVITVQSATGGDEAATKSAWNVKAALEQAGVPAERVRLGAYTAADPAAAPVLASFKVLSAVVPQCGREWNDLTATRDNRAYADFGCSVTANLAAQIANPRDIGGPAAADPADAGRRSVVLDKYRKGEMTASAKDASADGKVAQVVQ
ncbi:CpaD family pilus assembly lipoprotein [Caulobacter sp. 17J65-9]|uniref:CpaD family pilus assembly protein n=1 Tax=Caulobacter sp. 17J65-9 TaxID=2709382 RepID=UPI0013CB5335|nr:CpaD family pilus assembly lipoprotein [Caulobacter sp. 17J65-9]NEX94691.1 pilus assembly protein CpaD [Caulobacter sp. 17J65-9]